MMRSKFALLAAGLTLSTACAPIISHRGYFADPRKSQAISVGVDTKETIQDRLGTPTQIATFDPDTWYYISSTEHVVSWQRPKTVNQSIIAVAFDADGKVKDVKRMDKVPSRKVALVSRITPARGRELSFWEQIFGNVGRMPQGDIDRGNNRTGPPRPGGGTGYP